VQTILGVFNSLEELHQAQITLYNAWEKPAMPGNRTWRVSGIESSIVSRANQPIDFVRDWMK